MKHIISIILVLSLAVFPALATENSKVENAEKKELSEVKAKKEETKVSFSSVNGVLFVETEDLPATLYIYTLKGTLLAQHTLTEQTSAFPLSRGTYLVRVGDEKQEVRIR